MQERLLWAKHRIRAFMLVLLYSGLRISDVARLRRSQLNAETGHLMVRQMKTTPVCIQLPQAVVNELLELPVEPSKDAARCAYFFWNGASNLPTIVGNLRRSISRLSKIAKIRAHPHRFRDTFAKRLLDQDVPLRTVSLLLGHQNIRTTERYYAQFVRSQQRLLDAAVRMLPAPELLPVLDDSRRAESA